MTQLNGEAINNHPIITRLIFLRQLIHRMKGMYSKVDYQVQNIINSGSAEALDGSEANGDDLLLLKANLNLEDNEDEGLEVDDELDEKTRKRIEAKAARQVEIGNSQMDINQRKKMIAAIRNKREEQTKDQKKQNQFEKFRKQRMLGSKLVKEMEDELEERPEETERRPNIKGVFDPLQERREKHDEENFGRTVLSKEQKKAINKRVERLKQQQKIDDLSEISQFGQMAAGKNLLKNKKKEGEKKRGAWQKNTDEEAYESKRAARKRSSGKLRHKKRK